MTEIVRFVSKAERDTKSQIESFIGHARTNYTGVLGLGSADFEKSVWSFDLRLMGGKRIKHAHVKFVKQEFSPPRGDAAPNGESLIQEPFSGFLKALFLHRLVTEKTQAVSDMLTVLKALEFVVRERIGDRSHPCLIENKDLIAADQLLGETAKDSAYRRAAQLQVFVSIFRELDLTLSPLSWKNTRPKPRELRMDINPDAESRRAEKLPSQKAIRTLIQLAFWTLDGNLFKHQPITAASEKAVFPESRRSQNDEKDGPVVLGLALCAVGLNCRISELVTMVHNPDSFTLSKGELDSDGFAEDEDRFALRWKPVKGGAPMVKPFSRDFAPFAQLIVEKLREFSEEPRAVARHYELYPKKLYLPPQLEHLRNAEWIEAQDVADVIGTEIGGVTQWVVSNKVKRKLRDNNGKKRQTVFEFKSLESALLKKLPRGFPYLIGSLKYSEAMFCCFLNQAHLGRGTCRVIPAHLRQDVFEHVLTERTSVEGHKSIFERYGFYEDDGSKIDMTTHEFRHFWQTQLKKAGVSELIAAYAAGRADKRQNEAYDMTSPYEAADLSFNIVDTSRQHVFEQSALAIVHEILETSVQARSPNSVVVSFSESSIVTFDKESGALNVEGCHLTKYGICKHNYISSGCPKFAECIECDDLFCVKGVAAFEENAKEKAVSLRQLLIEYRQQLESDVLAGVNKADNWLKKTNRQLDKLDALIADIYMNESVPKGTVVQLSAELKHTSALGQALVAKLGQLMSQHNTQQLSL